MPANENNIDLPFPLGGLDVTAEFQEQKPGTTPEAINVRGFDPIARRARGGSRPGIAHYAPGPVPADTTLDMTIQHLAIIVDPHATALPQNFETPGDDWVEDPLNPGTFVPPGGWGNPGGAPDAEAALAFVQSDVEGFDFTSVESTANFPTTPGDGSFILAILATGSNTLNVTLTVTNGALNAFTRIGAYKRFSKAGVEHSLSLWWKEAADGASEMAVKVTPSATADLLIGMMEFSGPAAAPVGDTANNSGNALTMTTGSMTGGDGDAVVGAFLAAQAPDTVTPGAGYTLQINHPDGSVDLTDLQLYVIYRILAVGGAENPQATFTGGADDFAALGLVIKD